MTNSPTQEKQEKSSLLSCPVCESRGDGSETFTSLKQALYFKQIGFTAHDTMIYAKCYFMLFLIHTAHAYSSSDCLDMYFGDNWTLGYHNATVEQCKK